ncbi:hypothetical protein HH214_15100 [Mucilaginibacter robiniae]|uniref:Uncharacterized protein n=1 Tax=Mucilaginibacter robiniae TaxID=2728022 RepID=A0A7L5E147_9SPHI|nr:hypothetical protein [Mucilaginibacter robiniae]QJD97100.1 hypothetical protein HH214_15100 [Mucilaginibacter robiniae]
MSAIFFTVENNLSLMVIPDTIAHLDGHAVITYTYSVFRDSGQYNTDQEEGKESTLHLDKHTDPNYMGYITFEKPNQLFTYTADGSEELSSNQVEEVIEQITYYRDNSDMWRHLYN